MKIHQIKEQISDLCRIAAKNSARSKKTQNISKFQLDDIGRSIETYGKFKFQDGYDEGYSQGYAEGHTDRDQGAS